jgi:hypothetical protein
MTSLYGALATLGRWAAGDRELVHKCGGDPQHRFRASRSEKLKPPAPWLCLYAIGRIMGLKGTVPVAANGGFGDTTGTVPFGEERRDIPTLGWASVSRISIVIKGGH